MRNIRFLGLAVLLAASLVGCGGSNPPAAGTAIEASKMTNLDLNAILAAAKDGDTITMPAGKFTMRGPLQIANKKNLTLVGAGNGTDPAKATILSFKNALTQNGISASNTNNITFKNFAVEDASGNALFVTSSDGVVMDTLRAEWTTDPQNTSTMAYGLYPVRCDNVLVTNSIVVGSRDAGVYVGQSTKIRVTKNDVYANVAGVEIENSHNAVVEDNYVHQNTGGILVFALTGQPASWTPRTWSCVTTASSTTHPGCSTRRRPGHHHSARHRRDDFGFAKRERDWQHHHQPQDHWRNDHLFAGRRHLPEPRDQGRARQILRPV